MSTRVLVADDEALIRGSFRLLVDTTPGLAAVGEAATGEDAVAITRRERPDVVLMDVRMPVMDGIEATRRICAEHPEVRVLIVTTFDLDEYVYGALRAGAAGFLIKDTPPPDLLKAIHVIAGGESLLAPPSPGGSSSATWPTCPHPGIWRSPAASVRCSSWSPKDCPIRR